jgi:Peptidase A4 family
MRHQRLISSSVGVLSLAGMLLASSSVQAAAAAPQTKATKARAVVEKLHVLPSQRTSSRDTVTQYGSLNWSGYAAVQPTTGGPVTYQSVSAQWSQPALKCTSEDRIVVFWSGIDGFASTTVEQDGTLGQCFEGTAFYYTWWEMYPTNSIQTVGSTVKAGDQITASVSDSGGGYVLAVTDATTAGNSFSTTQTCSGCANSSAEVIAERPSSAYGIYPLAQFSTWTVTNILVNSTKTISNFAEAEIQMVDITDTYVLAQPSSFHKATKSFTDKWKNSY